MIEFMFFEFYFYYVYYVINNMKQTLISKYLVIILIYCCYVVMAWDDFHLQRRSTFFHKLLRPFIELEESLDGPTY